MEIEKEEGEEGEKEKKRKDHHQKLFITIFEKGEEKINVGSSFFLLVASALGIHLKRERGGRRGGSKRFYPTPLVVYGFLERWLSRTWGGGFMEQGRCCCGFPV